MAVRNNSVKPHGSLWVWLAEVLLIAAAPALGQVKESPSSEANPKAENSASDYAIGPGDILAVNVMNSPELGGKFRVTEAGYLRLPGLTRPVKAEGLTAFELSQRLADALEAAELMREPMVTVFIDQYHGREVTVLGAVARPAVYTLQKPTTLMEVLSMAGGTLPTAGRDLTIVRKGEAMRDLLPESGVDLLPPPSTVTIDLAKLVEGKDPSLNVEVHAGDLISVQTAPVCYVVGAVNRPGGFILQDPKYQLTVLKAMGLAGGLAPTSAGRGLIIRRGANSSESQSIPINLRKLMAGKIQDLPLEGNDILFVPESSMRKGMAALTRTGQAAAQSILIYTGYRVIQ